LSFTVEFLAQDLLCCRSSSLDCSLDLDGVSIAEVKVVSKLYVGRYFENGLRMVTALLFVRIRAQDETSPAED
jgi:hypothetical protein